MSDEDEKVPGPEATPEEKRIIVAHDCALEILAIPPEERRGVVMAIEHLVLPREPEEEDPMASFANGALALLERALDVVNTPPPRQTPPPYVTRATPPPAPTNVDSQMSLLSTLVGTLSGEQKIGLVRLLSPEQRESFKKIFGVELPDLPDAH